jgi:hypothetical protein
MASTFRVSAMFRAGNIYQWLDLSSRRHREKVARIAQPVEISIALAM